MGGGGPAPVAPAAPADVTPPVISAIASSSVSSTVQTITWTTDEPATSQINYGTTASYGSASSSAALTTSHAITLTGLAGSTVYHFQIQSADSSGNIATSNDQSFTTPPSWVMSGAQVDLNFVNNQYWNGAVSDARASTADVINTNGSLSSVSANTSRISADEVLNEPSGLLVESGIANEVNSPTFAGATVGVLGSGGTLPTGWSYNYYNGFLGGIPAGVTVTITEVDSGGFNFTLTGTPSASNSFFITTSAYGTSGAPVSAGQTWTVSSWLQAISTTGITLQDVQLYTYDSGGAYISTMNESAFGTPPNSDIAWPVDYSFTMPANTSYVQPVPFWVYVTSGTPVNASYRISRPQFERMPFRTTFQPTATRNADVVTLNNASTYIGAAPWTTVVSFNPPRLNGTATIFEASDGTANNRISVRLSNYTAQVVVVSGGSTLTTTNLGYVPILTKSTVALSVSSSSIIASLNGKSATTISLTPPSGLNKVQLGGGTDGYLNSTIGELALYSSAHTAAQVAALALHNVLFFDDFQRADGAIGTAPTGQSWVQVPTSQGTQVVLATISSDKLFAADSGHDVTAAYSGVAFTNPPNLVSNAVQFSNVGGLSGSGEIVNVENANGLTTINNITTASDHMIFGNNNANFAYFSGSSYTAVYGSTFSPVCPTDGATICNFATGFRPDGSVVFALSDGELWRSVNANYAPVRGPYTTWEQFWTNSNPTMPSFYAVGAQ
ncbi:MAG TPA: M10 family metallopeptidase C-terminal domain-containing protein [Candidatus Paceibacterota bacterium]|nr:M10 family metallopeptidase C-terminal domain-containing protein [Candidatus Paceibacterota bacterium]